MRPELAKPSHSARCVVLGWRAVARGRGGPLRPSRPGGAYIAVFAMCVRTRSHTYTRKPGSAGVGGPDRQNNSKFAKRTWNVLWNQQTLSRKVGPRHGCKWVSRG